MEKIFAKLRTEEVHERLRVKAAILYTSNGIVSSTNSVWLKTTFDTLKKVFDRLGLQKNVRKNVGMICQTCWVNGMGEYKSYTQRVKGEGQSYRESHWEWVICPQCRKDLAKGSLVTHFQTQHGVVKGGLVQEGHK